ncbi:MAG TPA: O-antigen ligase family protein [Syntrophales bacterium]|nr:O-antigen ligase family protein [Syntrophales bacterium]
MTNSLKSMRAYTAKTFFSFEFVFLLFLFAGCYKARPWLHWVPVDLTALFFAMSVAVGMFILARKKARFAGDALIVVGIGGFLFLYATVSLTWSPGVLYAGKKALYLCTLTFWPLIAAALIVADRAERVRYFLGGLFFFALWFAVESLFSFFQSSDQRLWAIGVAVDGADYISIGRIISLGAISIYGYYMLNAESGLSMFLSLALLCCFVFVLMILGGRGPLLGMIVSFALIPIAGWKKSSPFHLWNRKHVFLMCIAILAVAILAGYMVSHSSLMPTIRRTYYLFVGIGESPLLRLDYYWRALRLWVEAPILGHGLGSWPLLVGFGDIKEYPHNVILELLVELGLVGFLLFLAIPLRALYQNRFLKATQCVPTLLIILMIFVDLFVNALCSGDLSDNRLLFAAAGMLVMRDGNHTDPTGAPG